MLKGGCNLLSSFHSIILQTPIKVPLQNFQFFYYLFYKLTSKELVPLPADLRLNMYDTCIGIIAVQALLPPLKCFLSLHTTTEVYSLYLGVIQDLKRLPIIDNCCSSEFSPDYPLLRSELAMKLFTLRTN